MAYLIVISLLLFFIVTVVLALMFCKFAFSLATKLIVKTCELEDTKEVAAVNFLLNKFVIQSLLLWCVVQFLLVYFSYDKIEDAMSLFGFLNSFLIVIICNFYLAKIKFNSRYLIDVASQLDGEKVEIYLNDTGSPALIKDPGDFDSIYVVMPMKG